MSTRNVAEPTVPRWQEITGLSPDLEPYMSRDERETAIRTLVEEVQRLATADFAGKVTVESQISGEAFLTREGPFTALVAETVKAVTGRDPDLSTTGGTSDARFIRALCPVVELGLVGATMHAVDERVSTQEVRELARLYATLIERYFETSPS